MTDVAPVIVQNQDGLLGVLEHPEALRVGSEARIAVRLTSGRVVLVPVDLMVEQHDGSFHLDLAASEVARLEAEPGARRLATAPAGAHAESTAEDVGVVVPVLAEALEIEKREVESGRVKIHKSVTTADQTVTESLVHEEVEVERVPINQMIPGPIGNRQEGDTLVVPVLKEVLVVEKRLMLIEEIRITRRRSEQPFSQTVPLRTETVVVERENLAEPASVQGIDRQDRQSTER